MTVRKIYKQKLIRIEWEIDIHTGEQVTQILYELKDIPNDAKVIETRDSEEDNIEVTLVFQREEKDNSPTPNGEGEG